MKPVRQVSDNDCFCACIASLLEVPLPLVPVCADGTIDYQIRQTQKWLAVLGYTFIDIPVHCKKGKPAMPCTRSQAPVYAIATLAVPGRTNSHAVVVKINARRIAFIHDPAGNDRSDYGKLLAIGFLVPLEPTYREASP